MYVPLHGSEPAHAQRLRGWAVPRCQIGGQRTARVLSAGAGVQDTVEAEQNVVMRMQREIARLKSVEIDNEYLNSENRKIKGELRELSGNLSTTRRALEQAKAEAEAQRQRSEATLGSLQTALDDIQQQVMSVVDESGGTRVLKSSGEGANGVSAPPVYDVHGDGGSSGATQGSEQTAAAPQQKREPVSASTSGREQ